MRFAQMSIVLLSIPVWLNAADANAAGIQGGTATYQFFNSFFVRFPSILPNTSDTPNLFYPDPENQGNPDAPDIDVEIRYDGTFVEVWQDQVGATIDFEITDIFGEGSLPDGTPFQILGGLSAPYLDPFLGTLTNIDQDETDAGFPTGDPSSLSSALRRAEGPFAQVLFPNTQNEVIFYGDSPYAFEDSIDALPYMVGQKLLGTDDSLVDIRLLSGSNPDPSVDPVIGFALPNGFVEITLVVPEPTAIMYSILMLAVYASAARPRRS